ncbi:hypothetical protein BOX15_Mlig033355g2 [Macrostomum lignano]|uniref:Uncharacterized protein n=1 Tax=Macrostomum lignano TaxID=282301 RepID=A0A267GP82_9PLAT|nr:hypothetical protein BOX15_Mlig033355g2 [Macrostomum lignano]
MSTTEEPNAVCSSRACRSPASDRSPLSGLQLCQLHMQRDLAKLTQRKDEFVQMLRLIGDSSDRSLLRVEQSALAAEIDDVNDEFDALQEKLQRWRERILCRVQAAHDSVSDRLNDASEAEQCEKDISNACEANDMRKVMDLTSSAELWLEDANERLEQFTEARVKLHSRQGSARRGLSADVKVRSVGDASCGVKQLNYIIDKHMGDVTKRCWLDDATTDSSEAVYSSLVCLPEASATIDGLENSPCHLTACCNTSGFGYDSTGKVAPCESSTSKLTPLPQSCLFVSFQNKTADHLLVTSLDGAVRVKYYTDLDWDEWISGLHCDNDRQMLFIAQFLVITVTNLGGAVRRVITGDTLNQSNLRITAIAGSLDKVFALNRALGNVLVISKNSGKLEFSIDVSGFDVDSLDELCLHDNKLLLLNFRSGLIHRVCTITGQVLAAYPDLYDDLELVLPGQVVMDSRGLMYVSENGGQFVRVLSCWNGSLIQTLIVAKLQPSDDMYRFGLAVIEAEDATSSLVVANERDNSLLVFYFI